jgi:hypothetical protein
LRVILFDEYQVSSGPAVQGANGQGFVSGHDFIDSAIKYCQGAPSISAFFAEMGGNAMSLFSCRINSRAKRPFFDGRALAPELTHVFE